MNISIVNEVFKIGELLMPRRRFESETSIEKVFVRDALASGSKICAPGTSVE